MDKDIREITNNYIKNNGIKAKYIADAIDCEESFFSRWRKLIIIKYIDKHT